MPAMVLASSFGAMLNVFLPNVVTLTVGTAVLVLLVAFTVKESIKQVRKEAVKLKVLEIVPLDDDAGLENVGN